ncbi:amidohydrolase [Streptomyces daliensis]|uniref:Amidohydrolase n=1 Tax=Streptomyces daliensis TaxID=299421 RepID=A0A8T4J059_9ACTN|nr:amidohydrolase [Streptomyces daliensis]
MPAPAHRESAADTVLTGARVRTLDPERPWASAVAVRDGRIAAVGEAHDVRDWRGPRTTVLDLAGATLVPGLVDSHSHPVWGVEMATGADLSGCRDLPSLRAALADAARAARPGAWVQAWGLDHNAFGGRPVHRDLVEDALGGAPALIRLYDGHSALVNGPALEAAGIDGPRDFDQRASVVCDAEGRPTGHLVEHAAMELLRPVLPRPTPEQRRAALVTSLREMAAAGLTGAHVMDLQEDVPALLSGIEEGEEGAGVLPVRLRIAPWCMPGDGAEALDHLVALQGRGGRHWRIEGVKFFMDGTVEGGTAWLEHADCHGQGTHAFWPDPRDYARAVRHLARADVRTATHAIGDAAVRHVLDTVAGLGGGQRGRHRIEHIETLPTDQIARFAPLGVAASMQPTHTAYTRADHTDEWSRRIGAERAARAWRCRDLRDSGAVLALGSDWPIAHYDPRRVMAAARLRRLPGEPGTPPVGPEQALTGLMALEGCTSHAALAAGEEAHAGRVAPGCRADLTALALDPVTCPPDELAEAPVRLTMTGGHVTHRA